jgi:hypothetical protein
VPGARGIVLSSLVVAVGSLPSCGGDHSETCYEVAITYAGAKAGAAYLRVASDDGGRTLSSGSRAASIQFLIAVESGGMTCSGGGQAIDIPITAAAWIDVSGAASANCSELRSAQCEPSPGDPQAHQTGVLRFGQLTKIRLDVADPP